MHIFLPSLPRVAREFNTDPAVIQLTVTLYLAGMAAGQLVYGPLSDRYGRRPVLLWGMVLFIAATIACIAATTTGQLIAARIVQSVGACAGMVLCRAMVRDGVGAEHAATALAYMSMATVVAPGLGPAFGGYIDEWVGWRYTFGGIAALAGLFLVLAVLTLPETFRNRPPATSIVRLATDFGRLLRMPVFVGYALCGSIGTGSFFAMATSMPFLLGEQLHRPTGELGLYFALISSGFMVGSFIAARLSVRFGTQRMLIAAMISAATGALVMLALAGAGIFSVAALLAPFMGVTVSNGINQPNAISSALGADPRMIGAASGLYGFIQMASGALATWSVALFHDGTQFPVVWCVVICAFSQIAFFMLGRWGQRRRGLA